jgi:hypothetical protein
LALSNPSSPTPGDRCGLYIALIVIMGVIIGTGAGVLAYARGANIVAAADRRWDIREDKFALEADA